MWIFCFSLIMPKVRIKSPKSSRQSGIASVLIMLLVLAGIGVGVYLVQQQTNIKPQAATDIPQNSPKQSLVFQLDQGWGNGIIEQQDLVGLDNVITSLKSLQASYNIYADISPVNKDKAKIKKVLDRLAENKIPFYLDVLSSDVQSIGRLSFNTSPDPFHGVATSLADLKDYKSQYGNSFQGIRFMEVFSMDMQLKDCKKTTPLPDWCPVDIKSFPVNFYEKPILESYISFAKQNKLTALWVSPFWFGQIGYPALEGYEKDLKSLIAKYPDTLVLAFANNVISDVDTNNPPGRAWTLKNWYSLISKFNSSPDQLGVSAQAWTCPSYGPPTNWECDFNEFIKWVSSAQENSIKVIQFEPNWYFWQFPVGVIGSVSPQSYQQDGGFPGVSFDYNNRGKETSALIQLKAVLLPNDTSKPIATEIKTEVSCQGAKPVIKISWKNPNLARYHQILRRSDSSKWAERGWTDGSKSPAPSEFIDDVISSGVRYMYGIKTYYTNFPSSADLSQINSYWTITPFCETATSFGAPQNVYSQTLGCTNNVPAIKISWINKPFTTFHRIERTTDNINWKTIGYTDGKAQPPSTEYIDSSVEVGKHYAYKVYAAGDIAHAGYSQAAIQTNSSWPQASCTQIKIPTPR